MLVKGSAFGCRAFFVICVSLLCVFGFIGYMDYVQWYISVFGCLGVLFCYRIFAPLICVLYHYPDSEDVED